MKLLDKLEKKLARFSIPNLMRYIIFGKILVYIVCLIYPEFYEYIYLEPSLVLKGQVWRLVTFLFLESGGGILLTAIELYFYYFIGSMLEARWGTFRFNLFFFTGTLCTIAASFIFRQPGNDGYLYESLFLAFATLYPELQVMLFFIIPIKVKWMGILTGVLLVYQMIVGGLAEAGYILLVLLNYILFFAPTVIEKIKAARRKQAFAKKVQSGRIYASPSKGKIINDVPFHRCHVCGKTDLDDPNMTFRYCSQCNGNYEYCEDHLHNHEHVK